MTNREIAEIWLKFVRKLTTAGILNLISVITTTYQLNKGLETSKTEEDQKHTVKMIVSKFLSEGMQRAEETHEMLNKLEEYAFSKERQENQQHQLSTILESIPKERMYRA